MGLRGGSIFGAEKCLKEFRRTCLICFADAVLVQSNTSIMFQKCSFEPFKTHQNCEFTRDYSFSLRHCSFGAFFAPKLRITCQIAILMRFKWFEWALLVHYRSIALHQNCICEANSTRVSELLQTLFCIKNRSPRTYNLFNTGPKVVLSQNFCASTWLRWSHFEYFIHSSRWSPEWNQFYIYSIKINQKLFPQIFNFLDSINLS